MASNQYPLDTTAVLNIAKLTYGDETRWEGFSFDKTLQDGVLFPHFDDKVLLDLQPETFALELEEVPIPSLDASSVSSYNTAEGKSGHDLKGFDENCEQEPWEDIWAIPEVQESSQPLKLTSWDHFSNGQHTEPGTAYLSEADAQVFDAIIASSAEGRAINFIVQDQLLHSLYALALGRSSLLFQWDKKDQKFSPSLELFTVSGCTPSLIQLVIDSTASTGTTLKTLSEAEIYHFRNVDSPPPSTLSFLSALRSCLAAIQRYMDDRRHQITTTARLLQALSPVQRLLDILERINSLLSDSADQRGLLEFVLDTVNDIGLQSPQFEDILNAIISAIAMPLLRNLGIEIGLQLQNSSPQDENMLSRENSWVNLLSPEAVQMLKETQRTLALLRLDSPARLALIRSANLNLDFPLGFTWTAIIRIQTNANEYEQRAKSALGSHALGPKLQGTPFPASSASNSNIPVSFNAFELLDLGAALPKLNRPDIVFDLTLKSLQSETQVHSKLAVGYDEVLTMSIFPIVSAQHRLLSYSILHVLFNQHNLMSHLQLQHRTQLLGDGVFAARLSVALFDSDQTSGEGKRKTNATTGLRLQTRENWPPASSELRLVLMGILYESLTASRIQVLEDTMSFSVRELSDEELERCRNVDSIHALDFLKIQYRPSSPVLETVISADALEKYDRIFTHVLRILRLRSVAQSLLRDVSHRKSLLSGAPDQKFRIEIQHFMSNLADYCQNVAINRPWTHFENTIKDIQKKLSDDDYEGVLNVGRSLEHLRHEHEGTLNSMLRGLLLKKNHTKVLEVLEEILDLILQYAAACRNRLVDDRASDSLREEFRRLVRHFVGQLGGKMSNHDQKGTATGRGEDLVEDLLLRLDFNGYWSS